MKNKVKMIFARKKKVPENLLQLFSGGIPEELIKAIFEEISKKLKELPEKSIKNVNERFLKSISE